LNFLKKKGTILHVHTFNVHTHFTVIITKHQIMETKTTWTIDPTHSEVQFKVKHLVISTVTGTFKSFEGSVASDGENFDGATASFNLDVNSIDTNVADRDAHLKSDDFFNAASFPHLIFKGTLKKVKDDKYTITGPLTIRDTTKDITLDAEYGGQMADAYGQHKAGFEISGKVSRKEFGLKWDMVTEAGGVVVGDEVRLVLNVQVVRK
jgi:polyisoprenoid-binding protein YceI